jgi:hypothetical protein
MRVLFEGEEAMSTYVQFPAHRTGHVTVDRGAEKRAARGFDGTRASASLLLAAIVAALVVVANQVIDTWTEGHLLAAWIVMWAVAFAGLALLAAPVKRAAAALRPAYQRWSAARRAAAADEQLWNLALIDARVMADISRAMSADALRDVKAYV